MKNKKLLIGLIILLIIIVIIIGSVCYYEFSLNSVSSNSEEVTFVVEPLTSKKTIIKNLKEANLIKNDKTLLIYLFFHKDLNLQAGTYLLNRNMKAAEILDKIHRGDIKLDTITITFYEGKNINDLIKLISKNFYYSESEIKAVLEDQEFITQLIDKYPFLTNEILNDNIYYALEGYLFPDTYTFLEDASVEDIIIRFLDNTKVKLESLQSQISNSKFTIHEILTMASIAELEAITESDRQSVAQVIYKRLDMGKGLGMDVTTYYAVKKTLGEPLTMTDLMTNSPYNTSESNSPMAGKLPVGPICNPSLVSIRAVLNPSNTDYIYFYANIKTHEVFFANTYDEFLEIQKKVGR